MPGPMRLLRRLLPRRPSRRGLRTLLLLVVPLVAVIVGGGFYLLGGRYVTTENAYTGADKVMISPRVAGPVTDVAVHENDAVDAGTRLFTIDPAPYRAAVDKAEATLANARTRIRTLKAQYAEQAQALAGARHDLNYAQREYERHQRLAERGVSSESERDRYRHERNQARDKVDQLERALQRIRASLAGDPDIPVEKHPDYRAAAAALTSARLDLQHTQVTAPFAGRVAKVPDPGQYVTPGGSAMALVASHNVWVTANVKETALTHVKAGQPVTLYVDTYPDVHWSGHVESIAQATGAEFSVLPSQNATGNWVKVVQRVPVRIAIDAGPSDRPLRAGLSTEVEIDTGWHPRGPAFLQGVVAWARDAVAPAVHAGTIDGDR